MRRVLFLGAAAALAALAACSSPNSTSGPAHDVAYYRDHPDDRAAKLKACQNDQGKLAATSNCINALAADSASHAAHFYDAPQPEAHKPATGVADPGKL